LQLTGTVSADSEQWFIETAARRIVGVESLSVRTKTIVPEPNVRTDDDIERERENALGVKVSVPNQAIKVMVSRGSVTLSGGVAWGYERWIAEAIVSGLMSVTGVNSQFMARP
jgi:osmotically-inducible protein OsmY